MKSFGFGSGFGFNKRRCGASHFLFKLVEVKSFFGGATSIVRAWEVISVFPFEAL